jgi:hypothetical protein
MSDGDRIIRGEFYEDCRYHPMPCVASDYDDDELLGISLVVGGEPGSCSPKHCGVVPMTADEAIERATTWDLYANQHALPTRANLLASLLDA